MAQPIFFDNYSRQLRAQAAAAPYEFAGQAVKEVAGSIEQLLFHAQQVKADEKEKKLALMSTMVSKYGFKTMGPDFAVEWEKNTGMKFPRDATGNPVVPQTDDEQIRAVVTPRVIDAIKRDPQQALVKAGLLKPPPSAEEQSWKDRELSIKEETNRIRAKSASLHYGIQLAKARKDDMPSGLAYSSDMKHLENVGFLKRSLTNAQVSKLDKVVKFNMQELDEQKKQADIALIQHKMETGDDLDKQVARIWSTYSKLKGKDKTTADALIHTWTQRHGIEVPAESKGAFRTFVDAVSKRIAGGSESPTSVGSPIAKPKLAPAVGSSPLAGKSDEDVKTLLQQRLQEGMNPMDIIEQSGNDMRVVRMLSDMVPVQ